MINSRFLIYSKSQSVNLRHKALTAFSFTCAPISTALVAEAELTCYDWLWNIGYVSPFKHLHGNWTATELNASKGHTLTARQKVLHQTPLPREFQKWVHLGEMPLQFRHCKMSCWISPGKWSKRQMCNPDGAEWLQPSTLFRVNWRTCGRSLHLCADWNLTWFQESGSNVTISYNFPVCLPSFSIPLDHSSNVLLHRCLQVSSGWDRAAWKWPQVCTKLSQSSCRYYSTAQILFMIILYTVTDANTLWIKS